MKLFNFNLKIGSQLLALFLIFAILPTTIITAIIITTNNTTLHDSTGDIESIQKDAITGLSFEYADIVNNWVSKESQIIQSLSQDPTLRSAGDQLSINNSVKTISEINSLFESWTTTSDSITDLILANYTTGKVLVSYSDSITNNVTTTRNNDPSFIGARQNQGTSLKTDKFFFQELYYSTQDNSYIMAFSSVIRPLKSESASPSFVLIERINPNTLWDLIAPRANSGQPIQTFYNKTGLGNSGEIVLINSNGLAISRSRFTLTDSSFILKNDYSNDVGFKDAEKNGFEEGIQPDYRGIQVFGAYMYLGKQPTSQDNRESDLVNRLSYDLPWVLAVKVDKKEVLQPVTTIQNELNLSLQAIFAIIIVIGLIVIAISFFVSRSFSKPIGNLSTISQSIAEGNLTVEIEKSKKTDEIGDLQNAFNTMIDFLKPSVNTISDIAKSLAASAQELASSSEEVNASSEEMSSVSQQISKGAQQQSEYLNSSMKQMDSIQKEFSDKVANIKVASDVIENISNQVNMLALNASIEAARAGEYGRGFAVVADNIRHLADEAKTSVGRVTTIIDDLSSSIENNMKKLNNSLVEVTTVAEETASGAEEASAATEEQAATMEELSAAAQELAKVSLDLETIVNKFKIN